MRALFVLLLALLPACSSMTDAEGHSEGATPSGAMNLSDLQKELKGADVVFFGELHDNTLAHQQRFMLFQKLAAERGDVIVSMEMFERGRADGAHAVSGRARSRRRSSSLPVGRGEDTLSTIGPSSSSPSSTAFT
jgi:hypothetical protein